MSEKEELSRLLVALCELRGVSSRRTVLQNEASCLEAAIAASKKELCKGVGRNITKRIISCSEGFAVLSWINESIVIDVFDNEGKQL